MLQIRYDAFETNSSSVHAFYIKKDFKPTPYKNRVILYARLHEYDWDHAEYANTDFLSYCWSTLASYFELSWKDCAGLYGVNLSLGKRIMKAKRWKILIQKILKPYNVTVAWKVVRTWDCGDNYVDHADRAFIMLKELLKQPELFVSAVLCSESHFITENDSFIDTEDYNNRVLPNEKEGFVTFFKGN